jgi:ribonuclease HII
MPPVRTDPLSTLFAELGRLSELGRIERELQRRGYGFVAGVDEVGRGALAGPVVAAAVILPAGCVLVGLDDSKQVDPACRERLAVAIRRHAIAVGVGVVSAAEIDVRDILRASLAAMRAAVLSLDPQPHAVLVDAVAIPGVRLPQLPIVHGDALCSSVAAASLVAKVERDRMLNELGRRFPAYGFEHHKGYGTPEHWQALSAFGPCAEHRLSYHGVVTGSEDLEPITASPMRRPAGKSGRTG